MMVVALRQNICKRYYITLIPINYQVQMQRYLKNTSYTQTKPQSNQVTSQSTGQRPGISNVTAQQKQQTNFGKYKNVSFNHSNRVLQSQKRGDVYNNQLNLRASISKEQVNQKLNILKNNVSIPQTIMGNMKINEVSSKQIRPSYQYQNNQYYQNKRRETMEKQANLKNQSNYLYQGTKLPSQDKNYKRLQQNITNEYRKLEEQRLKNQRQVGIMKNQLLELENNKRKIQEDINLLNKEKQKISTQIEKYKLQQSRYSESKGNMRIAQNRNQWSKRNQETQGINKNNLHIRNLQKELQRTKAELDKANYEKQTLKRKNQYGLNYSRDSRQKQSEQLRKDNIHLNQKNNQYNKQLQELKTKYNHLLQTLKKQQSEKEGLAKHCQILQEETKIKSTNNLSMNSSDWKSKCESLQQQLQKIKKQNQEVKSRFSSSYYYKKIAQNQKFIDDNKKKLQQLNTIIKKQQQEKNHLKNQLEQYKRISDKRLPSRGQTYQHTKKIEQLNSQIQKLKHHNMKLIESQKSNNFNPRTDEYMQKIRQLQQEVENHRKNQVYNKKQLDQNMKTIEKLKEHDQLKKQSITRLEKQNEGLQTQIKDVKQKLKELKLQSESPNKQLSQLQKRNANLQQEIKILKDQNNRLASEKNSMISSIQKNNSLIKQNEIFRKQIQQLSTRNGSLQIDLAAARKDLKTLTDNNKLQAEKNSPIKSKNIELNTQNVTLKAKLNQALDKCKKKEEDLKLLKNQNDKLLLQKNKQLQNLKSELTSKSQEIKKYQKYSQQRQQQINHLSLKLGIVESERESQKIAKLQQDQKLRQENARLFKQIWTVRESLKTKDQEVKRKVQQLSKLKQQKTKQLSQLTADLMNKQKTIKELQKSNSKNIEDYQKLKNVYQILDMEKRKLEKNNVEQSKNLNRLTSQLQSSSQERVNQIDFLKKQLKNKESTIQSLKKQVSSKQAYKARPNTEISTINDRKYKQIEEDNKKLMKKLQNKESYLQQLQSSSQSLQENYLQIVEQKARVQEENTKLADQNKRLKEQINNLSQTQSRSAQDSQKYSHRYSQKSRLINPSTNQQKRKLEQQIKKLQTQISRLNRQSTRYQEDYKNLNDRYSQQKKLYDELAQTYQSCLDRKELQINAKSNTDFLSEFNKLKYEYKNLQNILKQRQQELQIQIQNYNTLKTKNQNLLYQLERSKQRIRQLQAQNNKFGNTKELESKNKQIIDLKKKNQDLSQEVNQLKSKIAENENKIKLMQSPSKEIQSKNREINALKQQIQKLNIQLQKLQSSYSTFQKQRQRTTMKSQSYSEVQLLPSNSHAQNRYLFHGQILRDFDEYKTFIKKCIQTNMKIEIIDTRLIYKLDPLIKQNVHKFIDEKPHLVVIVKMINGYFVAGYAEGFFKPRSPSDKQGLLMSLTNQKCYNLVQRNKRSITYDDFYVIFGNSQIRLKSQQKKIFSNFGLSNSYYRHNGDGMNVFLGGGKSERQMEVVGYEFHQLILKQ